MRNLSFFSASTIRPIYLDWSYNQIFNTKTKKNFRINIFIVNFAPQFSYFPTHPIQSLVDIHGQKAIK